MGRNWQRHARASIVSLDEDRCGIPGGMGTRQALADAANRGTGLLSTRGGGRDAAAAGRTGAVASHACGERVGHVAHSMHDV